MSIINKKSVILFIILLMLSTNLFKVPSAIFRILHVSSWMIVNVIVPLAWILFILSLVDLRKFKKIRLKQRKNKKKLLIFFKKIDEKIDWLIEWFILFPLRIIGKILKVIWYPFDLLFSYLNKQKLKVPILRSFTANTFIVVALILLAATPFALVFGKEKLAEKLAEFAYFGLVMGVVGKFYDIAKNPKKWNG